MKVKKKGKVMKILGNWRFYQKVLQLRTLLFTKLQTKFMAFVEKKITKRVSEQSKLFYKTINELPLYNFVECLVNKDFTYLYKIKPKKYFELAEVKHFEALLLEYSEAMTGGSTFEYLDLIKFYNLISKIRILESASGMIDKLTPETIKILKKCGIKITGEIEKDYNIITGKLETFKREIETVQAELKNKETENKKAMSFDYFESILSILSTNFKFHIDIRRITVAQFCSYFNTFKKQVEQWQKNQSTK